MRKRMKKMIFTALVMVLGLSASAQDGFAGVIRYRAEIELTFVGSAFSSLPSTGTLVWEYDDDLIDTNPSSTEGTFIPVTLTYDFGGSDILVLGGVIKQKDFGSIFLYEVFGGPFAPGSVISASGVFTGKNIFQGSVILRTRTPFAVNTLITNLPDLSFYRKEGGLSIFGIDGLVYNIISLDKQDVGPLEIMIDIKPQSCPNPLNINSHGVLSVAILGTAEFDVNDIDVTTVELVGVSPLQHDFEDVATPFEGVLGENCENCTDLGDDGNMDLTLKFDKQEIIAALGDVNDGDELCLTLTGNLKEEVGGTPIEGKDGVDIKSRGNNKSVAEAEVSLPEGYVLLQNHPNPFNPTTTIKYELPGAGFVTLKVYDVLGNEVALLVDEKKEEGRYQVAFDASTLSSGVYIYYIRVNEFVETKKMVLLR